MSAAGRLANFPASLDKLMDCMRNFQADLNELSQDPILSLGKRALHGGDLEQPGSGKRKKHTHAASPTDSKPTGLTRFDPIDLTSEEPDRVAASTISVGGNLLQNCCRNPTEAAAACGRSIFRAEASSSTSVSKSVHACGSSAVDGRGSSSAAASSRKEQACRQLTPPTDDDSADMTLPIRFKGKGKAPVKEPNPGNARSMPDSASSPPPYRSQVSPELGHSDRILPSSPPAPGPSSTSAASSDKDLDVPVEEDVARLQREVRVVVNRVTGCPFCHITSHRTPVDPSRAWQPCPYACCDKRIWRLAIDGFSFHDRESFKRIPNRSFPPTMITAMRSIFWPRSNRSNEAEIVDICVQMFELAIPKTRRHKYLPYVFQRHDSRSFREYQRLSDLLDEWSRNPEHGHVRLEQCKVCDRYRLLRE